MGLNKSLFLKVFGDSIKVQVLDYLLTNCDWKLGLDELSEDLKISKDEIKNTLDELVALDVIVIHTTKGKQEYYQLNLENETAKAVKEMDNKLMEISAQKAMKEDG